MESRPERWRTQGKRGCERKYAGRKLENGKEKRGREETTNEVGREEEVRKRGKEARRAKWRTQKTGKRKMTEGKQRQK